MKKLFEVNLCAFWEIGHCFYKIKPIIGRELREDEEKPLDWKTRCCYVAREGYVQRRGS